MKINSLIYYTTFNKRLLYQIDSHYSLFDYKKEKDIFRYGSRKRQQIKYEFGYNKLVEDHHIIPKEFRDHLFIRDIRFDIGCSKNIRIMPNEYGCDKLNLPENTLVHHNGHIHYNDYVKSQLDDLYITTNFDESKYKFLLFFSYLESQLDYKGDLPW
jgi:hypothetical protein